MNTWPAHKQYRLSPLWLLLSIALALACNLGETAIPTPYPTYTPYATYTPAPVANTDAATQCQPSLTATTDVNVRKGPSKAYDIMGALRTGESANVLGRSEDQFGEWWYIQYTAGTDSLGWVWGASVNTVCVPSGLQVVAAPPIANTNAKQPPTATFTSAPGVAIIDHIDMLKASDIEVLKVWPSSTTSPGVIGIDIRNNGPLEFSGTFHVVCAGMSFMRAQPTTQIPVASDENIPNTISVGTGFFYTGLAVDPITYSYQIIQCVIEVPNNLDPNPGNNTGATAIP